MKLYILLYSSAACQRYRATSKNKKLQTEFVHQCAS